MTDQPATPPADDGPTIRPFAAVIAEIDKGRVSNELAEKLHELIAATKQTGKGGSLTFTMKVGYERKTEMLRLATSVVSKTPQPERAETMFFVDKQGNAVRSDPSQIALFEANKRAINAVPNTATKEA